MKVLGIETSCDDTGVAIYDSEQGLLINRFASQVDIHSMYGGVVPELAARDHIRKVLPLVEDALEGSGTGRQQLDAIAYTAGPGLIGALLVGATVGRSLAFALDVPAVGVHHMEGHLLSPMLESEAPDFPFLSLLVSGGHTMLVDVHSIGEYKILGQTRDDAVGEAFDKFAKVLGFPFPGGPSIEKSAIQGDRERFRFPRPMAGHRTLEFSFSGLKTHAMLEASKHQLDDQTRCDLAYAFQEAAVDALVSKCAHALDSTGYTSLIVAGGVGANRFLRDRLTALCVARGVQVYFPSMALCTDNGAMIAYAGYMRLQSGQHETLGYSVQPRWSLEDLPPVTTGLV